MNLKRIYDRCKNKFGITNCFRNSRELFSDQSMEETLDGKRAIFRSVSEFQFHLAKRIEQGKRCGYHISESEAIDTPLYMMYNKLFSTSWRVKIDSM